MNLPLTSSQHLHVSLGSLRWDLSEICNVNCTDNVFFIFFIISQIDIATKLWIVMDRFDDDGFMSLGTLCSVVALLPVYCTRRFNEVERGYTGFTLSVCPSVDRIMSTLYLQQCSSDPFHICPSYQATSEGVVRVKFVSNFKNLKFWQIL